jgi:HAT1-interacting factor 1
MFLTLPLPYSVRHRSKTHAEDAPEMAEIYFAYGKALLENAIVQNSVLGKEREGGAAAEEGQ